MKQRYVSKRFGRDALDIIESCNGAFPLTNGITVTILPR